METQYLGTSNAIVTAVDGVTLDSTKIIYNKSVEIFQSIYL